MEELQRIVTTSPHTEEVVLETMGIDSLEPLMPLLGRLTRLRTLKLGHNHLQGIPHSFGNALPNLTALDISQNPVAGLGSVITGLASLPSLRHLWIDLPVEADEDEVIVTLAALDSFNGTALTETADVPASPPRPPVARPPPSAAPGGGVVGGGPVQLASLRARYGSGAPTPGVAAGDAAVGWAEGDAAEVHRLYLAANAAGGRAADGGEFADYTRNIVRHLQNLLSGEDDPLKRGAEILKAKKILFEYCFEEISRSAFRTDAPHLSSALTTLQDSYAALLDRYDALIRALAADRDAKLDVMRVDIQRVLCEVDALVAQADAGRATAAAAAASGVPDAAWEAERAGLLEEIGWVRAENEKLAARLRHHELARSKVAAAGGDGGGLDLTGGGGGGAGAGASTSPARGASAAGGAGARKELTLRQLRDVIDDVYASKSRFDIKCAEAKLPSETMEQHLYTYLNTRYGLRPLILDWAAAILAGVRRYAAEDNDVAVFGKILRNEVDEEFRFVQRQLRETVFDLLRVYLKGKHPLKPDDEVLAMTRKRCGGFVHEDEWVDIVKYMYNTEDALAIIVRIKERCRERAPVTSGAAGVRGRRAAAVAAVGRRTAEREAAAALRSDACIPYAEFVKILLDFQLSGHERFLAPFVRMFRHCDADRNGILNEGEFRQLLHMVDGEKSDSEVTTLLDFVDPHNNQLITFSQCVTFLSADLTRMAKGDASRTAQPVLAS